MGIPQWLLIHISCVLKRSGTSYSSHEPASRALIHISWVLYWSGTYFSCHGYASSALIHISCVFYWSGIYFICHGYAPAALIRISCVLGRSGKYHRLDGSWATTLLHAFWLKWSKIFVIQRMANSYKDIFFQNAPLNRYFEVSIHSMQKTMKNDDSIIEAIARITPFIDVKTTNHTLRWWFYHYKTYENTLKFNFWLIFNLYLMK